MTNSIAVSEPQPSVVLIEFNRPERRNALDESTIDAVHAVLDEWRNTPSILVFSSAVAGVFVSGADISELIARDADDALRAINAGLFDRIEAHRWPTIAAIDGWALGGGCELALACYLRFATPSSVFGQPEVDLGIIAGAGAHRRLPATVGLQVARRMLFTGARLSATEAHAHGLVDDVVPTENLRDTVLESASRSRPSHGGLSS